jgi:3-isopropylmalate dehydrogenase
MILSAALMFELGFQPHARRGTHREAVNASMEAGIVTEDIAEGGKAYKTSEG